MKSATEQIKNAMSNGLASSEEAAQDLIAKLNGFMTWQDFLNNQSALTEETELDYVVNPSFDTVWVTAKNISVYIRLNDEGVSVDLFGAGAEDGESLAGTWAMYQDAEYEIYNHSVGEGSVELFKEDENFGIELASQLSDTPEDDWEAVVLSEPDLIQAVHNEEQNLTFKFYQIHPKSSGYYVEVEGSVNVAKTDPYEVWQAFR